MGSRDAQRAALATVLADGRGALIVGEPGIGKTHLARQITDEIEAQQQRVVRLVATGSGDHQLYLFRRFVNSAPALGATDGPMLSSHDILRRVIGDHDPATTVLHVDDVHVLDPGSAAFLAEQARWRGLRLLLTCRTAPGPPEALLRLWRDGLLQRVDLEPLTDDESREIVIARCDGVPIDAGSLDRIMRISRGNPLFLNELTYSLIKNGALTVRRGSHVWTGEFPSRGSIIDILRAEMEALPRDEQLALAFMGLVEEIPAAIMGSFAYPGVVDRLRAAGYIERAPAADGGFLMRIGHPMYAEAARSAISEATRREVYRRALDSYLEMPGPLTPLDAIRCVLWSQFAQHDPPWPVLEQARSATILRFDRKAMILVATAVTDHPEASSADRANAYIVRADAHRVLGNADHARGDLDAATLQIDAAAASEQTAFRLRRALVLADVEMYLGGSFDEASAVLDEAAAHIDDADTDRRASFWVQRVSRDAYMGELSSAYTRMQSLPRLPSDSRAFLQMELIHAYIETELGRFQSARERIGGWVERATGEGRLMLAGHLLGTWVIIDLWAGQIDEARELGERLVNGISFVPDLDPGIAALIRCNIAIHSGHWTAAVEHGQAACAFHDSLNSQGLRRGALASLALALAASGQHTQALQVAHEAELARVGSNQVVEAFSRIYLLLAGMWIRQPGVAANAAEAVDWACRNDLLLPELWLRCAQSVIDPGTITRSVQDRVAELVRQVDAPIAGPLAEHINAVATEDPSQVDLGRRALARLGLWLPPGGRSGVLTAREREVANLASLGYSSKAIAERLVLSPRTVETHLRHAFTKLDISSRDELPSALGELER